MPIEVDLDHEPEPSEAGGWLDHPKRVAFGFTAVGVLVIAIVAVLLPSLRAARAPAALPSPTVAPCSCLAGETAPLPAFTITETVKGDLYPYEDTGRWTWQQAIWLPSAFGGQPGLGLVELQTTSVHWPRITVATAGPHELALRVHNPASGVVAERVVDFAPVAVYDRWVSLRVTSIDIPAGDEVTLSLTDTTGVTTSISLPTAVDLYGPVTGFGLLAPLGAPVDALPGPEVKYGPPSFTATC